MIKRFIACFLFLFLPLFYTHSYSKWQTDPIHPNIKVIKLIHLDDRFTADEKDIIMEGFRAWETSSNGIVKFVRMYGAKEEGIIIADASDATLEISRINVEKDESTSLTVLMVDYVLGSETLGFYDTSGKVPVIILIPDRYYFDSDLRAVAAHEAGHALGLKHSKTKYSLMYPSADFGSECITKDDMENFCQIYTCDYRFMLYCKKN